jgi:archaellum component FlaC
MLYQSQNDPKWKNEKLGFSNETIGNFGCVITCLANLFEITPLQMNEWMKQNGAFVNGNLTYWAKIPGFIYRGWSYNNDEVKKAISQYGAVIVEVDFDNNSRTDLSHYVIFIGNQKLFDVWDGKEKPTSTYSILKGYIVYDIEKGKNYFKSYFGNMENKITISSKLYEDLVKQATQWSELVKKLELGEPVDTLSQRVIDYIEGIKSRTTTLQNQLNQANGKITELETKLAGCEKECQNSEETIKSLNKQLSDEIQKRGSMIKGYQDQINTLQGQVKTLNDELAKAKGQITELEGKLKSGEVELTIGELLVRLWKKISPIKI